MQNTQFHAKYTPPTPTTPTVESRRRCECTRRQSWPSLQFPVLLSYWVLRLVTIKWRHNEVVVEKGTISIKIHVIKQLRSVSKLSTESVGSRRELVAIVFTLPTPTRLNSTVASCRRRRCVLGFKRFGDDHDVLYSVHCIILRFTYLLTYFPCGVHKTVVTRYAYPLRDAQAESAWVVG